MDFSAVFAVVGVVLKGREGDRSWKEEVVEKFGAAEDSEFSHKRGWWGWGFWLSDACRSLYIAADPHNRGCFCIEALSQLGKEERPCTGHSSACGCNFAELKSQSLEEGLSQVSA